MSDDFVHLHLHSDMSQLDGCAKISDYMAEAKKRGHRAIGLSEHGTMRGCYEMHVEAEKLGIKPIYGIEFYVSPNMRRRGLTEEEKDDVTGGLKKSEFKAAIADHEDREGIRDRWHLTVWAKTEEGLRNLFRLSSAAWVDGFYYKPRIDLETLCKFGEGLAVATGCLSSPLNDCWLRGQRKRALGMADVLYDRFGSDMWLEVQPHNIDEQRDANRFMMAVRGRYPKSGLLATQDAHYLHRDHAHYHDVLLCIGTGAMLRDRKRFQFPSDEFWFRTRKEMEEAFSEYQPFMSEADVKEALDNTIELADQCTAALHPDNFKCLLPPIDLPEHYFAMGEDGEYVWLRDSALEGLGWRDIPGRAAKLAKIRGVRTQDMLKIYKDRLRYELRAIRRQKFVSYFLIVQDLYKWVRGEGIFCGPGRGSSAGSLVAYLLGITSVDPIEHDLLFERFLNPARINMPDIDMDFEDVRRQEIVDHLVEKYGRENVCQISTHGRLSGKQCLKDVSRVHGVPFAESNEVTSHIIDRMPTEDRANKTIEDSLVFDPVKEFARRHPEVMESALNLEGMTKNVGIHAAAVVMSPVPLTDIIPLETRKPTKGDARVVISAPDMYGVEALGLLKLDVLGLRTMTVLRKTLEAVEERTGERPVLEDLELDDKKSLKAFSVGDFVGIFQYDSASARKLCDGVRFTHFEDIAAMTAVNRPGGTRSGLAEQFIARKKKPSLLDKALEKLHPKVRAITESTLGVIVYQEQVMRIFAEVAGYNPGETDKMRKLVAKKIPDELRREKDRFIRQARDATPDMSNDVADKLFTSIEAFGAYGFNKSHATAYAMVAYWGMWLKCRHPLEFYWALISVQPDLKEIRRLAKEAKRKCGIDFLPPDVNISTEDFAIDYASNAIRGSLLHLKNVGVKECEKVVDGQPYKTLLDLMTRGRPNRRALMSLAKSGALDSIIPNRRWVVEHIDDPNWWKSVKQRKGWELRVAQGQKESVKEEDYDDSDRLLVAQQVNPLAFGDHALEAYHEFIDENVAIDTEMSSDDDFWKKTRFVWVSGVVANIKVAQVGDYHQGDLPDERERARTGWGKRYANFNLECDDGEILRVKVDWNIWDDFSRVCTPGTPVLVHAKILPKFRKLHAACVVSIADWRRSVIDGEDLRELGVWTSIAAGAHPAHEYPWPSEALKRTALSHRERGKITGVIAALKVRPDKRGRKMANFTLIGASGTVEVVCFGSAWPDFARLIKAERLITAQLEQGDSGPVLDDRTGKVWLRDKTSTSEAGVS